MKNINPLLLIDFYKSTHPDQYPRKMSNIVSYFIPRMCRLPSTLNNRKMVMFGLQAFIKDFLIEEFDKNFFQRPFAVVEAEYRRVLDNTLGKNAYDRRKDLTDRISSLHKLGYLPLEIRAIPEGTKCNVGNPIIQVSATRLDSAWLVNTIESLMSAELWHTMLAASVGSWYRDIVESAYKITVDNPAHKIKNALGDFSLRGAEGMYSGVATSSAFCLSFLKTATVPAALWLEKYYNKALESGEVIRGGISTEHSVMCSNFSVDGDEITHVKRLLTEVYPNDTFSMVSDSYDYWNMVDNIIPSLKAEIEAHNGVLLIRGDSGDPVDITTKTVKHLWDSFGGTINEKGYRVLNPKIRVIYGDSITLHRCRKIYEILEDMRFSAENVYLGVGSFSFQCLEDYPWDDCEPKLYPFTRDTFGIAVKSTYCEITDISDFPCSLQTIEHQIYKAPKTDRDNFKTSHKGCCIVKWADERMTRMETVDGLTYTEACNHPENLLKPVFRDGKIIREFTLDEIRNTLNKGTF